MLSLRSYIKVFLCPIFFFLSLEISIQLFCSHFRSLDFSLLSSCLSLSYFCWYCCYWLLSLIFLCSFCLRVPESLYPRLLNAVHFLLFLIHCLCDLSSVRLFTSSSISLFLSILRMVQSALQRWIILWRWDFCWRVSCSFQVLLSSFFFLLDYVCF